MGSPPPPLRRGPGERFAAWVVTGPLGHLWSVLVDIGAYWLTRFGRRILRGARRRLRTHR